GLLGSLVGLFWLWAGLPLALEARSGSWRAAARSVSEPGTVAAPPDTLQGQQQAGQLMAAFDQSTLMIDRQLRVTHLNPPAEQLTGWRLREAVGRAITDVLPLSSPDPERFT